MAKNDAADRPEGGERPIPGQTIVIERRERGGIFRRIVVPLLLFLFFFMLIGSLMTRETGLPTRLVERYAAGDTSGPTIAIIDVSGIIMDQEVEHAIRQIRQARDDNKVKAVILRIDSPGGSVSGSDRIWREVGLLKEKKKPVVASLGGIAASGGYYVAAPADRVLAEPTTLTGSIGVLLEIPQLHELMEKVGVKLEAITMGEWKDAGSPFRALTDRERERWKQVIDDAYQRFVRVVAQGRKLSLDAVKTVADGKVLTTHEALQAKLIDEVGYLDDAILTAQRLAVLESARVIRYSRPTTLESLLGAASPSPTPRIDAQTWLRLQTPQILFLAR